MTLLSLWSKKKTQNSQDAGGGGDDKISWVGRQIVEVWLWTVHP